MKKIVFQLGDKVVVVSEIDYKKLHSLILKKVSEELANLAQDCYYPKVSTIYKDLLHTTNSNEKTLTLYSKSKYKVDTHGGKVKYYLLYDPFTTLLIMIVQEFLKIHDVAAALSAFHLFSLRNYTNLMHSYLTFCNPDYFRTALSMLSHNHLFIQKQTIPGSIMYLSNTLFRKYQQAIIDDDPDKLFALIYEIRTRFNQSVKSFARKYYDVHEKQSQIKSGEEKEYDTSTDTKIRQFADSITKNITVYKKIDDKALKDARDLTKFNRSLSQKYVETMSNLNYMNDINSALYIFLRTIGDFSKAPETHFIDMTKKLMAVKVSKQEVYFKKTIVQIHDQIIKDLRITKWFNDLSVQSKAISRSFVAYYLTMYVKNHIS